MWDRIERIRHFHAENVKSRPVLGNTMKSWVQHPLKKTVNIPAAFIGYRHQIKTFGVVRYQKVKSPTSKKLGFFAFDNILDY